MASDLPLITIFFALLFLPNSTFSAHAPQSSPSPSPQRAISPPPMAPTPSPASPPSRPIPNSPSPAPFPRHEDADHEESRSPAPVEAADLGDLEESEGMSGRKKAGIAVGVIAAGCVVGMAAAVYKKRQRNIRRGRYSYTDQRDFL
ncbi:hypothetical protein SASPL_122821 [Salvia splendens]|uniref:Uncharacterized protein n=1 Tax=Salvia splendens TaxID=180675 RepID=A0A8X8XJ39_SALSN|nr:sulfated surface glycoprotein 185-like [Salvia splendens]KAG6415410.1 hypothetical protein SASPL_122821 [Salvia splendens]